MATQNDESGRKLSVLVSSLTETSPSMKAARRLVAFALACVLSTLAGCWSPTTQPVEAVAKKLRELNPGFDGKVVPVIENGVVTELRFSADNVMDISPVRALAGLRDLDCSSFDGSGKLVDLSPLKDMKLEVLNCSGTQVSDLTPLKGMPLMHLYCGATQVSDLTPLEGMPLVVLYCGGTQVSDLTPLKGMPLTILDCGRTKVSDLTPLQGMNLNLFSFTPKNITKGLDVIRQMKSIQSIGLDSDNRFHPDDFWKKYDAGEFSK